MQIYLARSGMDATTLSNAFCNLPNLQAIRIIPYLIHDQNPNTAYSFEHPSTTHMTLRFLASVTLTKVTLRSLCLRGFLNHLRRGAALQALEMHMPFLSRFSSLLRLDLTLSTRSATRIGKASARRRYGTLRSLLKGSNLGRREQSGTLSVGFGPKEPIPTTEQYVP